MAASIALHAVLLLALAALDLRPCSWLEISRDGCLTRGAASLRDGEASSLAWSTAAARPALASAQTLPGYRPSANYSENVGEAARELEWLTVFSSPVHTQYRKYPPASLLIPPPALCLCFPEKTGVLTCGCALLR
jgi:hypothetical protein